MRIPIPELTRLAFIHAEQDVRGLAEAHGHSSPERAEFNELADQLHAYRLKRWGRTQFEATIAEAETVSVDTLRRAHPTP